MPQLNRRFRPPIKRHAPQEDDQRHRARPRGRGDDNADVVGRHSSQRHHAHIAQTNPREGAGTAANDYIQSWLKQTQSHRQHEPSSANESRRVPSRLHARESQTNAKKRARSPPDPVISPRRESHREPDYRFEKRPRHKVREDKYQHRGDGGKSRPEQRATVQDRTSQQVSKGRAEQDSHGTNTRRPGQSSKGLAERAMQARNARMEQKEQEDNEMDQFRAFFQHRTSSRRPPPQDRHSRQNLEELTYGNGSEAPWSRASSPHEGVFPSDRRISQRDTLGSPELPEQGRPISVWEAPRNHAEPASLGPHYTAANSTSYVTWSTSHHSEFFDDRFGGPPTNEREPLRNERPWPQAQPSLQSQNSNGSSAQRPHGYKDAEVQTDPIALSPQRHRINHKGTGRSTALHVEVQQDSGGTITTAPGALDRLQPVHIQEQAPEHQVQTEQEPERQSMGPFLMQQYQPVYAPLRRSEYFQGMEDPQDVLLVRTIPDRQTYQEVEKPALLIDRAFGNRLLLEGPCVSQPNQQIRTPRYRHIPVEDEEWLSNPVALAAERAISSPGNFGHFPPHENRGIVDFDQAKCQIEGPRQRSPKRGMADFIYEIEREALDSRRLDGSENTHSRSPDITDPQLVQAVVPWSSRSPGLRYDAPGPQNGSSGWFVPLQPSEGYGGF